ncbi:VOC family protein [Pseudomonas mohnii]|uniref:VOC family protein n=1 Tax=Pseudomonas mohnii TaxID=395600 RepID=UPI0018DE0F98|nr:VOC family protein [Pseudomonas mohnii]MBH8610580.1 VOC family protein [Pseudomonas mohnii]
MVNVIGIDHLAIRVSDLERSRAFYDQVLGFLGFTIEWEFDRVIGWTNGETMFWITETDAQGRKHKHRTGDVGYHHYAFELGAREDVDALYAFLLDQGVTIVDAPTDYPDYGEGYYAVYFLDPDDLKLEVMFFLEKQKRRLLGKSRN